MRKIKKLMFLLPLMLVFSSIYGQTQPLSYISPKGEEVVPQYKAVFEFTNQTDVGVTISIRQNFRNEDTPYSERVFKYYYFEPKETKTFSTPVKVDLANPSKVWFTGSTSAESEEYGFSGFSFERDIDKLADNAITGYLYEQMIYPGDELWPPVDPFPVIELKITN